MDINLLYRVSAVTPIDPAPKGYEGADVTGTVVAAVRAVNKSELLGNDRQLQFARDSSTRTTVIQVVSRTTGEVLEQIPPEQVLQILTDLTKSRKDESSL